MFRKILISCGIAAPVLYVVTAIVGAALRPDYSHITMPSANYYRMTRRTKLSLTLFSTS